MKIINTFVQVLIGISIIVIAINCKNDGHIQNIEQLEVIQNFEVDKKYKYEVTRGKSDSGKPGSENIKSSSDIELRVIGSIDNYKECSWKYGETKMIGLDTSNIDAQTRKEMNFTEGFEIKFLMDEKGRIRQITNFEECKVQLANGFKLVFAKDSGKYSPVEMEQMMNVLQSTYETPEMLVSTYIPELTLFFSLFGETIKADTANVSHSELPNPLGGRSFPTNVSTKIETVTDNTAIISVEQIIPSDELTTIMKETFLELTKQSGKPFNENEIPQLNMRTSSTFNFDHKRNVMVEVYSEKLVEAEGTKRIESIKVILKN